jgi:hypothetical protein
MGEKSLCAVRLHDVFLGLGPVAAYATHQVESLASESLRTAAKAYLRDQPVRRIIHL